MRVDVMTDIETLGTNADSTIIQIAAIAFDRTTGEHISKFNQIADISLNKEMRVTGGTIKWWLNTNKELLTDLLNKGLFSSDDVLDYFYHWLRNLSTDPKEVYLWGNGILFDNKMVEHQLKMIGLDYPIHYQNDRDVRTIVDLAATKLGMSVNELKEKCKDDTLIEHDAFDDVIYQISLVVDCYHVLMNGK